MTAYEQGIAILKEQIELALTVAGQEIDTVTLLLTLRTYAVPPGIARFPLSNMMFTALGEMKAEGTIITRPGPYHGGVRRILVALKGPELVVPVDHVQILAKPLHMLAQESPDWNDDRLTIVHAMWRASVKPSTLTLDGEQAAQLYDMVCFLDRHLPPEVLNPIQAFLEPYG